MTRPWTAVADALPPSMELVETRRKGEKGTNTCFCTHFPLGSPNEDVEWVEHKTGVTTITHSTFLPPTHWRLMKP